YKINGGRQDYIVYELQGREVTIELDRNYITPTQRLDDIWEFNREALIGYLENALYGIHGKVTDSRNGEPVPARISIEGHDIDSSHIYSDTLSGRFVRLIGSGSWSLTFSADGYRDTVVTGVVAGPRQRYDLMVQMVRIPHPVDTTIQSWPLLYPNPAQSCINAVIPEDLRGSLNIAIYDIAGIRIRDFDIQVNDGSPVIIDIAAMSPGIYTALFRNRVTGLVSTGRFVVAGRH
ncbi:MAG TPA: T9SS type A sorting domain-containing protein, partial [Bacteroidales bacterium]|nr:T9SS type A sorting domain-containing protein [Bacteroidales bacterium]